MHPKLSLDCVYRKAAGGRWFGFILDGDERLQQQRCRWYWPRMGLNCELRRWEVKLKIRSWDIQFKSSGVDPFLNEKAQQEECWKIQGCSIKLPLIALQHPPPGSSTLEDVIKNWKTLELKFSFLFNHFNQNQYNLLTIQLTAEKCHCNVSDNNRWSPLSLSLNVSQSRLNDNIPINLRSR